MPPTQTNANRVYRVFVPLNIYSKYSNLLHTAWMTDKSATGTTLMFLIVHNINGNEKSNDSWLVSENNNCCSLLLIVLKILN